MAQYVEVRGNIIEFPDGMSPADITAIIKKSNLSIRPAKATEAAPDPTAGMSTTEKVLAGIGKGFSDVGRGIGQTFGIVSRQDVADARERDKALSNTTAGKIGDFIGNAAAFAPTAMIPGANTITGGALIGAATGLMQPSISTAETLANIGLGGGAGALVPTAIRGAQVAGSMLAPLHQSGRDKIVGGALRSAAGNQVDDVMRSLQNASPRVPGSLPTVAEVANNPGIAALQRTATAVNPVAGNEAALRAAANNEARITALQGMIPDRQAAVTARQAATDGLYRSAENATLVIDDKIAGLMKRPVMESALGRARTLAANMGDDLQIVDGQMSGKAAHYIKMALDDLSNSAPTTGIAGNELRAIKSTREAFLDAIEKQIPEYGKARATYADLSRPVTQSDVLSAILDRSTNNVAGSMTPAAFNRALSDKTVQSVTKQAGATLGNTLDQSQMGTLNNILADLQASNYAQTAGRGVGSDTVQKLAYSNILDKAGVPSFMRRMGPAGVVGGLLERASDIAYKGANDKLSEQLARSMLSPELAAKLMGGAVPSSGLLQLQNLMSRGGVVALPGLLAAESP